MLYKTEEGIRLFEYYDPNTVLCSSYRCCDSPEDLYDVRNDLIDEKGRIESDDPLQYCQYNAFIPLRVKGIQRKTEAGHLRNIERREWVEYNPM